MVGDVTHTKHPRGCFLSHICVFLTAVWCQSCEVLLVLMGRAQEFIRLMIITLSQSKL